jgi:hypothetical protein
MERCGPRIQPKSYIHIPENVGECEGVSPHTPKRTPILKIRVLVDFLIFKQWFERPKFIGLKNKLYHWKAFKMYMSKWGCVIHLNTLNTSYGRKKESGV